MKCNQCGTEYEGNLCPGCGAKTETETPVAPSSTQQQNDQQPAPVSTKPEKKKKPFFLRWWFILIVIIVVGVVAIAFLPSGEKIIWEDMVLGDMLPEPPANRGEIHENTAEELWVTINGISDKQYADYVDSCKEKGFNVDAESDSYSYDAYNAEGYKLNLSHYSDNEDMSIQLEAPMEMTTIKWPTSKAGKQLPAPKSTRGEFSFEYDDNFFVYVGDTTKDDYNDYVNECSEKGFNVDFNKDDNHYYAYNSEGWYVTLTYEGNNVMSIRIDAPSEDDSTNATPTEKNESDTTEKKTEKNETTADNGVLDSEFKAAMDSYEEFIDEYVAFMKKYNANPSDVTLLADYADYMSKYADFVADFEAWEDEDMNAAETAYYIDVQARVNKKLLEITN